MARTSRVVRPLPPLAALIVVFLGAWSVLVVSIGIGEPEGTDMRVVSFGVVLGIASLVSVVSLLVASRSVRAIGAVSAGSAVLTVGTFAGATVGLPLVPVGLGLVVVGLVAAEETATPRRAFLSCTVAATAVFAILAGIAFIGRGGGT